MSGKKSNKASNNNTVEEGEAPTTPLTSTKTKTRTKPKSNILSNIFSLSTLSSCAALFYVYFAFTNLLNLMYPLRGISSDELRSLGRERMVYPFWGSGPHGSSSSKDDVLGLRVYLSSDPQFKLDYFSYNDEFNKDEDDSSSGTDDDIIRDGNSFLLWSEDDAFDATRTFPSRSFILVAKDKDDNSDDSCTANSTTDDNSSEQQSCSSSEQQLDESQTSFQFANKWLEESIRHEKQLQLDGGGIMAAMNSAGSGIESTSVLLTLYTSIHRNVKSVLDGVIDAISSGGGNSDKGTRNAKQVSKDDMGQEEEGKQDEEPKSIIKISPQHSLWKSLMSNGTAYVHVLLIRQTPNVQEQSQQQLLSSAPNAKTAANHLQQLHSQHNVLFGKVTMMKRELPLHVPSPKRLLYRDVLFLLDRYITCPLLGFQFHTNKNDIDDGTDCNAENMIPPWDVQYHQPKSHREYAQAQRDKKHNIKYPYWKPEVMIHLIQDDEGYPIEYANRVGFDIIQVGNGGRGGQRRGQQHRDTNHPSGYSYLPAVHVDEIGLTSDKYIPINETVSALPLRIGFHGGGLSTPTPDDESSSTRAQTQRQVVGLTPARYRLLNHLSSALESQAEMGFEQSDIDDLRRLIAETNVLLLAITILASVLHLLFEFLTFKSDVTFWNNNTDLTGLSVRALYLDWFSQVIILFYLIEMDSSLLMTIPTGFGMLIALWKCQRGAGLKFVKSSEVGRVDGTKAWYNKVFSVTGYELCATRLRAASSSSRSDDKKSKSSSKKPDLAALTEETDRLATRLLGKFFLLPLVVSYAVYSLVKEPHSGWYSWFITTASSFVYAVGFVLMTPQLFLNYKLKSVAHLPWRVLGYRFVSSSTYVFIFLSSYSQMCSSSLMCYCSITYR